MSDAYFEQLKSESECQCVSDDVPLSLTGLTLLALRKLELRLMISRDV